MSQLSYKEIIENQLPRDLYKSRDIELQTIGNSLDKLQNDIDDLEKEVNPITAVSKGLEQWERFFKLLSNVEDSIEIRRARVVSELIQFMSDENVIRKDEMEEIISLYTDDCEVIEHFADCMFDVMLKITGESGIFINIGEVHKAIKEIKPSWLGYTLGLEFKQKSSEIYIASCITIGERVTVYPWTTTEITESGSLFYALGHQAVEKITVYPKEVE
ncbi:putative phage tail protein [Tissierella praeacuta]|uniref:putative phage tail protein n=1 Tax=Tissierella praeacuta TaxID=43131 RepID=UPI001C0FB296|nr:putative phage tail protein [Tissierella praeacuta]MBU5254989.1 YmfQ family protein [Tissierella praeacuta]